MTTQTMLPALAAGLVVGVLIAHAIVASWGTTRLAGRIVLRAALAFAVLFLVAVGVGPITGKYRTVMVLSGSMQPAMPPGSMAVVVPVDPATIQVGDVLTYEAPVPGNPVVTHRVIEILEHGAQPVIRTKGDANVSPDQWTARISSSPAWRRVAVIPVAGTLIHSLRSPLVHRATVYVVPALLLIIWLVGIWSRESEPKRVAGVGAP
jgi:signal peptidase